MKARGDSFENVSWTMAQEIVRETPKNVADPHFWYHYMRGFTHRVMGRAYGDGTILHLTEAAASYAKGWWAAGGAQN